MADHMTAEQLRAEVIALALFAAQARGSLAAGLCSTGHELALGEVALRLDALAGRFSGMAADEPELEPSTTTQFVLEMACGKGGRNGYAPISKFGTGPEARAKIDAIHARYPEEEWRIMRIDETKTIVYATPEPPHV